MEYKNYYLNQVFQLAYAEIDRIIDDSAVEISKLATILERFTYEDFVAMKAQWLTRGRMLWFISGNYSKEQAKQTVEQALNLLDL